MRYQLPSRILPRWCFAVALIGLMMWTSVGQCQNPAVPANKPANKPANPPAKQAQSRYWTTQWAFDDVDVGKLSRRLSAIGIDTELELEGDVTLKLQVGIPTTTLGDAAAYRLDGMMTSSSLVVDGIQLENFRTTLVYRDGVATLKDFSTQVVDRELEVIEQENVDKCVGEIKGNGFAELVPRGDVSADVRFQKLFLKPITDIAAKFDVAPSTERLPQSGHLSGDVKFKVPLDTMGKVETYQLEGKFTARDLKLAGVPPADIIAEQVQIEKELLTFGSFSLTTRVAQEHRDQIRLFGNASIPLSGSGNFQFSLAGDDVDVGVVSNLANPTNPIENQWAAEGKIDFQWVGSGKLNDPISDSTWDIQGKIASPSLRVAGLDLGTLEHEVLWTPTQFNLVPKRDVKDLPKSFRLGHLNCRYSFDEKRLAIDRLDATLFDGRISGSASFPFDATETLIASLEIANVRPTATLAMIGNEGRLSASLSGSLNWQVPVTAIARPAEHQGRANFSLSKITLGESSVGDVKATLSAASGELTLQGEGKLFDGTIAIDTAATAMPTDRWSDVSLRTTKAILHLDGVSLLRVFTLATNRRSDLTGKLSGKLAITNFNRGNESKAQFPDLEVDVELGAVNHRSRLLSRAIRLKGKLARDVFSIDSLVGDYAGGTARASGRVHLLDSENQLHPRADMRWTASRVDLQRGLWFLGDTAENYQGVGTISATMAGVRESIRVRGSVEGRELAFYGFPLGSAHSGLVADADINHRHWNLRFPSVRSIQGGGRVEGELAISSGSRGGRGVELASRWRLRRVDLARIAKQVGQSSSLASGKISGEASIGGKSIRTFDDLTGRYDFQLRQTRGAGVPGLVGVSRFLGPVSLATQTFDVGAAKGTIGGGAVVVDEFWLGSDNALIRADGKVFLRSGRLDLNALIATGDYRDISVNLAQLAQRYALQSLLPTSAILDVSELLRDRTLVVRVLGRMNSPIIRLQPVETFREEAARFLLREGQRLIVAGVTAGAADGLNSD